MNNLDGFLDHLDQLILEISNKSHDYFEENSILIDQDNIPLIIEKLKNEGFKKKTINPLNLNYKKHRSKDNQSTHYISPLSQVLLNLLKNGKYEIISELIKYFEVENFVKTNIVIEADKKLVKETLPIVDLSSNNFGFLKYIEKIENFELIEEFIGIENMNDILIEQIDAINLDFFKLINLKKYNVEKMLEKLQEPKTNYYDEKDINEKINIIEEFKNKVQKEKILIEISEDLLEKKDKKKKRI